MDTVAAATLLCFLTLVSTAASLQDSHESCGSKGRFISMNRTLAPLDMITASGDQSIYPATDVYNFGFNGTDLFFNTWCTVDFDSDHPFIEIELTSPVLITSIVCSGTTSLRSRQTTTTITTLRPVYYYVTNFTIEFSPPDNTTTLSNYTTEEGHIKYFAVPWLNAQLPLSRPLHTRRIRFRPVDWFDSDSSTRSFDYVCLGVGLYGCLESEYEATVTATTTDGQDMTSTQSPTFTSDAIDPAGSMASQVIVRDYQALAIVLPIALLTIAITAILVGVGMYVCKAAVGRDKSNETDRGEDFQMHAKKLEMSSKSLELSQSAEYFGNRDPNGQATSIHVVKNIIYGSSCSIDHCSGEAGHTAAVYNSEYEPVNQDVVDTNERNDTDSLESNTAYGKLDIQTELQPFEGQNTLELKGNASYNSVSASPMFDDVEYSYPTTNFAHVKVGAQTELQPLEGPNTLELIGNASYNSVSASPVFDDVEYSYPATNFAPVKVGAQTELHPLEGYDTLELKGNASYNSVSASPVFDDVEYSYPATNFAPVKIN